jgi:hypothetical protein
MLIKFIHSIASHTFSHPIRSAAEVEDELALKWIASGIASPAAAPAPVLETADIKPPQNNARRTAAKR